MKNTIIVFAILMLGIPVLAQVDDVVIYPELNRYLQAEKNNHGLLLCINKEPLDYNRFIELYNQQNNTGKKTTARPVTFMDGPVVYSAALPVEISRNTVTLYQRYSAASEPSGALQLLGLAAGITAGALSKGRYTGASNPYPYESSRYLDGSPRYLGNRADIEAAYLQSTYRQHER